MHDAVIAEKRGTPGVAVVTDAFVSGAIVMERALGVPDPRWVVIDHPIASATDAELELKARAAIEQSAVLLGLQP